VSPVVIIKAIIIIDVFVRLIELANFTIRRIKGDPRQRSRSKVTIENWSKTSTISKTLSTYLSQWWIVKLHPYTITTHLRQCWHHTWAHHSRSHTSSLPCFAESAVMTSHRECRRGHESANPGLNAHAARTQKRQSCSAECASTARQRCCSIVMQHRATQHPPTPGPAVSCCSRRQPALQIRTNTLPSLSRQYTPLLEKSAQLWFAPVSARQLRAKREPRTNSTLPSQPGSALRHREVADCPQVADSVHVRNCSQKTADIDKSFCFCTKWRDVRDNLKKERGEKNMNS